MLLLRSPHLARRECWIGRFLGTSARFHRFQLFTDYRGNANPSGLAQALGQKLTSYALKLIVTGVAILVCWFARNSGKGLLCFFEPLAEQNTFKVSGCLVDLRRITGLGLRSQKASGLLTSARI
ncbi:MAG TPA: hypothetical protein VEG68_09070 [Terriglobales bacterium]|nr:hypothetical protein [Terriglobales bacterium]